MNHHSSLSAFSITAEEGGAHSFRLYGGDAAAGGTAAVPEGKGGDAGAPAFEPTSSAAAAAPATAEQSSSWVTDTRGTFMFLSPEACAGGGFDAYGADAEWRRRNERAEALARAFSADIAQQILNMVNPDWRRENEAKLRGYTSGVPATNSAGRSLLG